MDTKKFLLATLAGFVGSNIAYFVVEGFILKSYMASAIYEPTGAAAEGSLIYPLIAVLFMNVIMACIYPKGYSGGTPAVEGLRFGVLMGLFAGVPFGFFFGSMFPIGLMPILVLALAYTIEVSAAGICIGLVYGKINQTS